MFRRAVIASAGGRGKRGKRKRGDEKAVATAAELPEALVTFRDLYRFLKIAVQILGGTVSVGTRGPEAALALVDVAQADVYEPVWLEQWLDPRELIDLGADAEQEGEGHAMDVAWIDSGEGRVRETLWGGRAAEDM